MLSEACGLRSFICICQSIAWPNIGLSVLGHPHKLDSILNDFYFFYSVNTLESFGNRFIAIFQRTVDNQFIEC